MAYCKNKPTSDSVRVEHEKYFTSQQNRLGQKLNIEDLLIAPVQRLPKYQLLIKVGYSSNENKIAVTDTCMDK